MATFTNANAINGQGGETMTPNWHNWFLAAEISTIIAWMLWACWQSCVEAEAAFKEASK